MLDTFLVEINLLKRRNVLEVLEIYLEKHRWQRVIIHVSRTLQVHWAGLIYQKLCIVLSSFSLAED